MDLWSYRDRTVALLKRYARASVEVGRLPSLLGREFFRARVTSYSMKSFEDVVIFVHDMEQVLGKLSQLERKLIAMNVLEEYSQAEIARLMGCTKRWIEIQVPEAIDQVSRAMLESGLMEPLPRSETNRGTCQEVETAFSSASGSKDGENII
jgi:DNA-directed RNA polymerase specialized sigma24 family protein